LQAETQPEQLQIYEETSEEILPFEVPPTFYGYVSLDDLINIMIANTRLGSSDGMVLFNSDSRRDADFVRIEFDAMALQNDYEIVLLRDTIFGVVVPNGVINDTSNYINTIEFNRYL